MQKEDKRNREKDTIRFMINLYCRKKHHHKDGLCEECAALYEYASKRIDVCPFMETKTFCNNCKIHCYKKDMREQVRTVMRYSGPRMLLYKPVMALRHIYLDRKEKKKL